MTPKRNASLQAILRTVAQSAARPTGDQEVAGSTTAGSAHSFVEIDHEIFSTVILSFPLIKEVVS